MTPPASTEPMYLIRASEWDEAVRLPESAFNGMPFDEVQYRAEQMRKLTNVIMARGPVAQQAPVADYGMCEDFCIHYKSISTEMGEAHFCRKNDKLVENVTSCPALFQKLKEHDAALIAQKREKWEREHTKKPGCYNSCPFDDLCANDIEKIQEIERMAAAQAREDVLDEMRDLVRNTKKYGTIEPEELFHWTGIIAMIDSLRSEAGK